MADEMAALAFRLACAYGLADASRPRPRLPLYDDEAPDMGPMELAQQMWADDYNARAISAETGLTQGQVYKAVARDRASFPHKRGPYKRRGQQCREQDAN